MGYGYVPCRRGSVVGRSKIHDPSLVRLLTRLHNSLLAGLLLWAAATASPPAEMSLKDKVAQADVVALVHVRKSSTYPRSANPVLDRRSILRVVTSYKGRVEGTEITVAYGPTPDCRDLDYEADESWVVFLKRIRPGIYTTVNCHYGQMRPWEALLERLRKVTGPGTMIGSPLKSGEPLVLVPSELSAKQWKSLCIVGLGPGMGEDEVRAAAGKPDRTAHAGRWWYWKDTDVRVRFDAKRKVDLIEGPTVGLGASPLLESYDQPEAAESLGKPYASQGSWKFYSNGGRYVAVRFRGERLTRYCMTTGDQSMRAYINSLAPPPNSVEGPGQLSENR